MKLAVSQYQEDVISSDSNRVLSLSLARAAKARISSFEYVACKRLIDVGCCVLLMPVLLPILFALAIMVRLSSQGPILYREQRVGRAGKSFTIFKFRSMYTEEYLRDVLGYVENERTQLRRRQDHKHMFDLRVTAVGRLLRKLSLDELPQLINVLRGEMSLVGPRPVVAAELESYGTDAYFYKLTRPGVTGLWQVSGRSKVSYERRVRLDVEYCSQWTIWLDTKIFFRTIPVVLRGEGAY